MTPHKQSGIALITVLLILSLATVAAVAMTSRQQLDIRRTTNLLQIEEAYTALLGAEEVLKRLLIEDAKKNQTDSFKDYWADPQIRTAKHEVGPITVTNFVIEDLHGRFNINNLIDAAGNPSAVNRERFERLLSNYALPVELVNTVLDWIDSDSVTRQDGGAEDTDYLANADNPYITAQRPMASASEMNRLMGVNLSLKQEGGNDTQFKRRKEILKMILQDKLLTALPTGTAGTNINVNTVAGPYIYQMIVQGLDMSRAQDLFNRVRGTDNKKPDPFESVNDFLQAAGVTAENNNVATQLDVKSEYFLLHAEAFTGDLNEDLKGSLVVYSNTILHRTGNKVNVVHRSYGKLGEI